MTAFVICVGSSLLSITVDVTVILTLKSMEIDKRSNLEHHVGQAVTLAITTV